MAYAEYMPEAIQYALPTAWSRYDRGAVMEPLLNAKAEIRTLQAIPFQRRWVAELQNVHLKMEAAGTSRIEGADFTANELDEAMRAETPEQLLTRSQRQANAAVRTYREIARMPDDRPVTVDLIREIHRSIVRGCDDDHCEPGVPRKADHNVTFGRPRHRGVAGGKPCAEALERLTREAAASFREHEPAHPGVGPALPLRGDASVRGRQRAHGPSAGSVDAATRRPQGRAVRSHVELLLRQ